MICPNCFAETSDGSKFCGACGQPIGEAQEFSSGERYDLIVANEPVACEGLLVMNYELFKTKAYSDEGITINEAIYIDINCIPEEDYHTFSEVPGIKFVSLNGRCPEWFEGEISSLPNAVEIVAVPPKEQADSSFEYQQDHDDNSSFGEQATKDPELDEHDILFKISFVLQVILLVAAPLILLITVTESAISLPKAFFVVPKVIYQALIIIAAILCVAYSKLTNRPQQRSMRGSIIRLVIAQACMLLYTAMRFINTVFNTVFGLIFPVALIIILGLFSYRFINFVSSGSDASSGASAQSHKTSSEKTRIDKEIARLKRVQKGRDFAYQKGNVIDKNWYKTNKREREKEIERLQKKRNEL